MLPMQGAQVQSLVGEVRLHMPYGGAKQTTGGGGGGVENKIL